MRYEHPALIPQSDRYSELRWIGDRIPCATYNHRGDTHPQTWALHQNFTTKKGCELTVLESNRPWGPFNLVHCEWMWYNSEAGHYRPRVPLKWFDQEKLVGYLPCSANWEGQAEYYRPQLRKFKLIPRTRF